MAKMLKVALEAINSAGGSLSVTDVEREIAARVQIPDQEKEINPRSGIPRWITKFRFASAAFVKSGFVRKNKGIWWLTPEGKSALSLSADQLMSQLHDNYHKWKASRQADAGLAELEDVEEASASALTDTDASLTLENAEAQAYRQIQSYIDAKDAYEFQDLVAALLRALGYTTPFVAPKGPDGGIDVIAYRDPIGAETPHVRVQVKHRDSKASREEVAALRGIVRPDREVGLFVSTSGFSPSAVQEARTGNAHIELMDLQQFLSLWIEHYEKLDEEDKSLLPLRKVHFLAPNRE